MQGLATRSREMAPTKFRLISVRELIFPGACDDGPKWRLRLHLLGKHGLARRHQHLHALSHLTGLLLHTHLPHVDDAKQFVLPSQVAKLVGSNVIPIVPLMQSCVSPDGVCACLSRSFFAMIKELLLLLLQSAKYAHLQQDSQAA